MYHIQWVQNTIQSYFKNVEICHLNFLAGIYKVIASQLGNTTLHWLHKRSIKYLKSNFKKLKKGYVDSFHFHKLVLVIFAPAATANQNQHSGSISYNNK